MEKKVPIAGIPASFKAFRAMQYTDEPAERVPELLRYDSPFSVFSAGPFSVFSAFKALHLPAPSECWIADAEASPLDV